MQAALSEQGAVPTLLQSEDWKKSYFVQMDKKLCSQK